MNISLPKQKLVFLTSVVLGLCFIANVIFTVKNGRYFQMDYIVSRNHGGGDNFINIYDIKNKTRDAPSNFTARILYWTKFFNGAWTIGGCGRIKYCKYKCKCTKNKKHYNMSSAVIFHLRDIKKQPLPSYRLPNQVWILATMEPPHLDGDPSHYEGMFNATFTYRRTSHIRLDYSSYIDVPDPDYNQSTNYAATKTGLVAWAARNFHDVPSYRHAYVRELQKNIQIDRYGSLGKECPGNHGNVNCLKILSNYKFYLAFENCFCKDYVTEKAWKMLAYNTVPVVMGLSSYADILPPHSFIDVRDYPSPEKLAEYLLYLDKHDSEYNTYFQWKADHTILPTSNHTGRRACDLCEFVHRNKNRHNVVRKLYDIDEECVHYNVFFKDIAERIRHGYLVLSDFIWL